MDQPHFGDVKLEIEVICVVRDALWGVATWPIFNRKSCLCGRCNYGIIYAIAHWV